MFQAEQWYENPMRWFWNLQSSMKGINVEVLKTAIEAGYRYFDTASFYQTEDFLGQARSRESNLPREDFFLVSKMWKR